MTAEQQSQYFRWSKWVEPMICNDAQGEFTLSETLPTMYYHVLTAIPSPEAILAASATDSLTKSQNLLANATVTLDSLKLIAQPDSATAFHIDSLTRSIDSLKIVIPQQESFAAGVRPEDYLCSVEYDGLLYLSLIHISEPTRP